MLKRVIAIFFVITILTLFMPTPSHAFSITGIVDAIKKAIKFINVYKNAKSKIPGLFVFGGRITHSEGGCAIKYWVFIYTAPPFGQPITFPGPPIPIGGTTIEVGPPIRSPKGQIFTFPYVSDVYKNNSEKRVGPWALGIGFTPFPIDKINDALDNIPHIPIPNGFIYKISLDCSDDNKNVILKIGTSRY